MVDDPFSVFALAKEKSRDLLAAWVEELELSVFILSSSGSAPPPRVETNSG
jgi:hypothetical protein